MTLKEFREQKGLSQTELANCVGLKQTTISQYERRIIYQHVFEEKTFKEMAVLNELTEEKVKGIYYYAIKKIRKWMEGEVNGI